MRGTDIYSKNKVIISMEFFPPRDEKAIVSFNKTLDTLNEMNPDYMSITFGAGGSTKDGSYQTAKMMIDKNIPTVAYIAGFGLGERDVTEVLDRYADLGIETIFVIRGDEPKDKKDIRSKDFKYASDLIKFIKKRYSFTLGCAGYPEGHVEAENLEKDIEYLKLKVDNGADYIVCQYFYDNSLYFDYVEKLSKNGINVPVIPGIMPVYTVKMTQMLSKVCGSGIPYELQSLLSKVNPDDKEEVIKLGIDFSAKQCIDLLKNGVKALHFYTMNRSRTTCEIIDLLKSENLI